MTTFEEIHPTFREALAFCHGFYQLGFDSDNVLIGAAKKTSTGYRFVVRLDAQNKILDIDVGHYPLNDKEKINDMWEQLINNMDAISDKTLRLILNESSVFKNMKPFIALIVASGFSLPIKPN